MPAFVNMPVLLLLASRVSLSLSKAVNLDSWTPGVGFSMQFFRLLGARRLQQSSSNAALRYSVMNRSCLCAEDAGGVYWCPLTCPSCVCEAGRRRPHQKPGYTWLARWPGFA